MTTYETVAGTEPHAYVKHEPRTITRRDTDSDVAMMSEIGDGVFVQWTNCRRCSVRAFDCKCPEGPQEPHYMQKWRDQRFDRELSKRPDPDYPLLPSVAEWMRERGYAVALANEVAEAVQHAQVAQDKAYGDSNDDEIESLREALEFTLGLLGVGLPEGRDPDDEGEAAPDPEGGHVEPTEGLSFDEVIERARAAKAPEAKDEEEWDVEF